MFLYQDGTHVSSWLRWRLISTSSLLLVLLTSDFTSTSQIGWFRLSASISLLTLKPLESALLVLGSALVEVSIWEFTRICFHLRLWWYRKIGSLAISAPLSSLQGSLSVYFKCGKKPPKEGSSTRFPFILNYWVIFHDSLLLFWLVANAMSLTCCRNPTICAKIFGCQLLFLLSLHVWLCADENSDIWYAPA